MKCLLHSYLHLLRSISPRKQPKPHYHTQRSLLTSISSCNEVSICNEVLSIIENGNPMEPALEKVAPFLTPEVVTSVLEEKKESHELSFRFFIWAAKRKKFRSWESHNLILDMLVRNSKDNFDVFNLYWKILDDVKKSENTIVSDAFAVLISGYWKLKNAEKALETFGRMREFGCKPELFTYNMILHVMVQKDVILLALAVYNLMLKLNSTVNSSTFSILIDGLCKSGKTEDALKLFDEMGGRGILPSKITYTVILSGLCQAKRMDEAFRLFNLMKDGGCPPDDVVHNVLLNGFCKFGKIDEAFMLLRSFKNDGYVLGIKGYSCMIDGLIRANRIHEALGLFQQLFEIPIIPDLQLYTIMMRGLSQSGRVKDAMNLLADMTQRGIVPDTYCYNTLIKGFCDIGLLDDARTLKLEISSNNLFPDTCTYTVLICGLCKNGLLGEARHIFNEMEKLGCFPSVFTFNSLIHGLCKAGELEEAHLMFYKMEIGRNPSLFLRLTQGEERVLDSTSLQKMVEKLCESGLIMKAYNLLKQLADCGVVPNIVTYNILINGFCKAGKINGALKLFEELQFRGHSPDKITYGTLIDGLQRNGREEAAFELFEQMKSRSMAGPEIYKSLMTWTCRKKKTSLAFNLWLEYIKEIGNEGDDTLKLLNFFEEGNVEMAVRELHKMHLKLTSFDSAPYNILLIGMCQAHRTEDAFKLFSILTELHVNVSGPSCVMLIDGLCYKEDLDQAVNVFLHTIEKGLRLMPRICNKLLRKLLHSQDKVDKAFYLLKEMKSSGYDIAACLEWSTKSLLTCHSKMWESEHVPPG